MGIVLLARARKGAFLTALVVNTWLVQVSLSNRVLQLAEDLQQVDNEGKANARFVQVASEPGSCESQMATFTKVCQEEVQSMVQKAQAGGWRQALDELRNAANRGSVIRAGSSSRGIEMDFGRFIGKAALRKQKKLMLACEEIMDLSSSTADITRSTRYLGKSLVPFVEDCLSPMVGLVVEPTLWTGGMDRAPGFPEYLQSNPQVRLLEAGNGNRKQSSLFGIAMKGAQYLAGCNKALQLLIWGRGSNAYAQFHGSHEKLMSLMCGVPRNVEGDSAPGDSGDSKDYQAWLNQGGTRLIVMVGQRFGLSRHGSESVLFQQELWRYIQNVLAAGQKPSVIMLNFGPQSCDSIAKVPMGVPDYPSCTLADLWFADQEQCPETMTAQLPKMRWSQAMYRCEACNVVNRKDGPSSPEIEACKQKAMHGWFAGLLDSGNVFPCEDMMNKKGGRIMMNKNNIFVCADRHHQVARVLPMWTSKNLSQMYWAKAENMSSAGGRSYNFVTYSLPTGTDWSSMAAYTDDGEVPWTEQLVEQVRSR